MKTLTIDLGHGGSDTGATNKINESDIVLSIGKKLNEKLKNTNLTYKFTRLEDKYLSLPERCNIANSFKSDYFISIHLNSTNDTNVRGVEVFQHNTNNKHITNFSNSICSDISKFLNIRNRGLKTNQNFAVLKNTKMPACIIEIDFLSNNEFKTLIQNPEVQNNIVDIIFKNILILTETSETNPTYRICVSSFNNYSNAQAELEKVKKTYPSAWIIK